MHVNTSYTYTADTSVESGRASCPTSTTGIATCKTRYPGAEGACLNLATCKTTSPNVANTASCTDAKACDAFGSTYCCDAGQDAPTMVNGVCQCPAAVVVSGMSSRTAASTSVGVWGCALVAGLISFVNFMK
jgi:hypothetical protein